MLLSFIVVITAAILILIPIIAGRFATITSQISKYRGYVDGQYAVDQFAEQIKIAYDLATPIAESGGVRVLPVTVTSPFGGGINFAFPNGNRICVPRSQGPLMKPGSLGVSAAIEKICVQFTNSAPNTTEGFGSQANWRPPQISFPQVTEVTRTVTSSVTGWKGWTQGLHAMLQPSAHALSVLPSDPGPVSNAPLSTAINVPATTDATAQKLFKVRYTNNDCNINLPPDRFCLPIKFCLKFNGICSSAELVTQTYIFLKPPQTGLGL